MFRIPFFGFVCLSHLLCEFLLVDHSCIDDEVEIQMLELPLSLVPGVKGLSFRKTAGENLQGQKMKDQLNH